MSGWFSHLSWAQTTPKPDTIEADVPWVFFFVFGIPLFMTLVYLMMQLSRPDRGGRIDADVLAKEKERLDNETDGPPSEPTNP